MYRSTAMCSRDTPAQSPERPGANKPETIRTRSPVLRPRLLGRSIAPLRSRRRMAAITRPAHGSARSLSRPDGSLPDTGERRAIAARCGLKRQEIENIFDQFEALGWLIR